jgi:predicted Zn-ribbon and HTH transcriptional regulator
LPRSASAGETERVDRDAGDGSVDALVKKDKALAAARDLINEVICECGHWDSEHLMLDDTSKCGECRCKAFRTVKFTVERAK